MKTSWATPSASCGSASPRWAMPATREYSARNSASNDSSFDFTVPLRLPASETVSRLTPTNDSSTANGLFVTGSRGLSKTIELASQAGQEGIAPDSDRQKGGEDHNSVNAFAAFARPVDVLEVEPQGELVERQRRPDPVGDGRRAGEPAWNTRLAGPLLDQPHVPDHQEQSDTPDEVVDVNPAGAHVVKRADAGFDQMRDGPNDGEGDREAD